MDNHVKSITQRYLTLINHFMLAEFIMAFEKFGFLETGKGGAPLTVATASQKGVRNDLFITACEFLVGERILEKSAPDVYDFAVDPRHLSWFAYFLLAYKTMLSNMGPLMNGSKQYGRDILRDGSYLRKTGIFTRASIPVLIKRLRELKVGTMLDIGCGGGEILFTFANAMSGVRGIGIDIDESVVAGTRQSAVKHHFSDRITIAQGDARSPESFPQIAYEADAILGMAVFHEFRRGDGIVPLLKKYKEKFAKAKLFIVEFDAPSWDDLRRDSPDAPQRKLASQYKFIHVFSEQGLPQPRKEWIETFQGAGWRVDAVYEAPICLAIYECS